jgi:hypothetical protein
MGNRLRASIPNKTQTGHSSAGGESICGIERSKGTHEWLCSNCARAIAEKAASTCSGRPNHADEEIKVRKDPALRLPRQIEHIGRLVDHILTVKDSRQLRRSLAAHFERLDEYRKAFLEAGTSVTRRAGEEEEEDEE